MTVLATEDVKVKGRYGGVNLTHSAHGTFKANYEPDAHTVDTPEAAVDIEVHHPDGKKSQLTLDHEGLNHTGGEKLPGDITDALEKHARNYRKKNLVGPEPMKESTTAAATLAPESMPAEGKSKAGMMADVMGAMNGMKKSELVDFFNKSMAQFCANKFPGADATNNAAQNAASIKAKGSVKEDVEEMFDGEELSEEFKTKVETVFEAAVGARLEIETARIEEEAEGKFNSLIEEFKGELSEKVDEYLSYAVEQWVEENKIALENGLKIEIFENFFSGLKTLFAENNVSIPDEEVSLVGELQAKVDNLEARVNEEIEKNINLSKINEELEREQAFRTVAEGLAVSQVEKLKTLSENISFDGVAEYSKKLAIIKETYFSKKTSNVVSEEVVGVDELSDTKNNAPVTGQMAVYAQAISKAIKNV